MTDIEVVAKQLQDSITEGGILDVASCERIEGEDHPVFGVELKDGTTFFVEITPP